MAEEIYKGPSEEEVIKAFRENGVAITEWKACSVVLVGISQEQEEGKNPILYSFASYKQDLKRWYPIAELGKRYGYPAQRKLPTQYMQTKRYVLDEEGVPVLSELPGGQEYPLPHMKGKGTDWNDFDQYFRKMRVVPEEAFAEQYDPKWVINPEDPNQETALLSLYSWFRKAKWNIEKQPTIFRRPTGKFFDSNTQSITEVLASMTRTIRNIIWTVKLRMPEDRRTFHNIDLESLHEKILERLKTASHLYKLLRQAQEMDLESGYIDYKVMIVEPRSIDGYYNSIQEALDAVNKQLIQVIEEAYGMGELQMRAAELSKEEVRALIKAADVLDKRAPKVAQLVDNVIASREVNEVCQEDLVASLLRVADKLDQMGNIKAASLADRLIRSIVETSCKPGY